MIAALFEKVWQRAVPLNRPDGTTNASSMSGHDRRLLGLLPAVPPTPSSHER